MSRGLLLTAVIVGCAALIAWRTVHFAGSWRTSRQAETDLVAALAAQADVERLSRLPATAIAPEARDADILHEVEQTLSAAGLSSVSIKEIALEPPVQIPAQGVTRHGGRVSLERLTLDQLGRVLALWNSRLRPYRVERLDLASIAAPTPRTDAPVVYRVTIGFSALSPLADRPGARP